MNKLCTKCNIEKDIKYFSFRTDTKKYRNQCDMCTKDYKTCREDVISNIKDLLSKGLKECSRCKNIKVLNDFNNDKYTITGKTSYCKECVKNKYTPNQLRNFRYLKEYNITLDDYNIKYDSAEGKCEICNIKFDRLFIDHNHDTMEIRGLLCHGCNTAIGFLKEKTENLESAIRYLRKYNL